MTPEDMRKWRRDLGFTQQQAAVAIGVVERATISRWERGEKFIPLRIALACSAVAAGLPPYGGRDTCITHVGVLGDVCGRHGITAAAICRGLSPPMVRARDELCWRLRRELAWTKPMIGRFVGRRTPTAVANAISRHEKRRHVGIEDKPQNACEVRNYARMTAESALVEIKRGLS